MVGISLQLSIFEFKIKWDSNSEINVIKHIHVLLHEMNNMNYRMKYLEKLVEKCIVYNTQVLSVILDPKRHPNL